MNASVSWTTRPSGIRTVTLRREAVPDQVDAVALQPHRVVDRDRLVLLDGGRRGVAVGDLGAELQRLAAGGVGGGEACRASRCRTARAGPCPPRPAARASTSRRPRRCCRSPSPARRSATPGSSTAGRPRSAPASTAARRGRAGCRSRGCTPSPPTASRRRRAPRAGRPASAGPVPHWRRDAYSAGAAEVSNRPDSGNRSRLRGAGSGLRTTARACTRMRGTRQPTSETNSSR